MKKIIALSGSLRTGSYNSMLIKSFGELAPENIDLEVIEIGGLPLINQDLEADPPQVVKYLWKKIGDADAVLLATPEYNRSYSPVLKNALDWGSRPEGTNKWKGKPAALVGCSPYNLGAFGAVNHLRQVVMYLDMPVLQQPEFYLSRAAEKFEANGKLNDEETKKLIVKFWDAFITWINHF